MTILIILIVIGILIMISHTKELPKKKDKHGQKLASIRLCWIKNTCSRWITNPYSIFILVLLSSSFVSRWKQNCDSMVIISFRSLDIEMCSSCECDFVQYSSSESNLQWGTKSCGRYSYNYLHEYLLPLVGSLGSPQTVGSTVYFRFVSDDSAHYKGFNLNFIALSSHGKK